MTSACPLRAASCVTAVIMRRIGQLAHWSQVGDERHRKRILAKTKPPANVQFYCFQPPSFQMVCYIEFLAVLTDLLSTPGSPHKKGRRFLPCAPLWGSNVLYGALGLPTPSSLRVWKKRGRIIMRPPSSSAVHRHRSSWTEAFLVPSRYRAYVLLEKAGA